MLFNNRPIIALVLDSYNVFMTLSLFCRFHKRARAFLCPLFAVGKLCHVEWCYLEFTNDENYWEMPVMRMTMFDTPVLTWVMRALGFLFLSVSGWRAEGINPLPQKFVLIGAPHTSIWDVPVGLSVAFAYKRRIFFMVKDNAFFWPVGPLLKWLGAIPVNRRKRTNMVAQTIELFQENEELIICVPPEGTRSKRKHWKTGFYYIALGAGVPIALGFMDFKRKRGGVGAMMTPTGDIKADFEILREFYKGITAKYPEKVTLPSLPPEKETKA